MLKILKGLVLLAIVGFAGYAAFAYAWGVPTVENHATANDEATIVKGRYLAAAGDCVSCHSVEGETSNTGGRAFETPFGTLYSSNITPDEATGIGGMTSAEFYQIMAFGADSVLTPTYPAMPYTSFHFVTRDDSDAIHAYLMSLQPVEKQEPRNALYFPFGIRPLMFGWNFLFASREPFEPDPGKDDAWNRGAYLVKGLGHCGECHTPRNFLGAVRSDAPLAGAVIGGMEAPDLTPDALAGRGWTWDFLVLYFETGASPKGSAFGEMFLAVKNSLRLLTHEDRVAIATYLMDGSSDQPSYGERTVAALGDAAHENAAGQALYLSNCSLCHGAEGAGIANTMPPLKGNATVGQEDGRNLVRVIADGLKSETMSQTDAFGPMPAYRDRLSAEQIADLANFTRSVFASNAASLPTLSASDVERMIGR